MINYKQILEAVNRGIRFVLDDFEDNAAHSIYMIKFFKNEVPSPKFLPFKNIGGQLPPVRGHIRPIWYK